MIARDLEYEQRPGVRPLVKTGPIKAPLYIKRLFSVQRERSSTVIYFDRLPAAQAGNNARTSHTGITGKLTVGPP
jgi:hypothetical protein